WDGKLPRFEGYLFGFYFWLDVLAAWSMLLYIPPIAEGMLMILQGMQSFFAHAYCCVDSKHLSDMGLREPQDFASGTDISFLIRTGRVIRIARLIRYAKSVKSRYEAASRQQEMLKLI